MKRKINSSEMPCGSRVGLTAGRVLGNAVERNRIKRRMRQAIRQAQTELTASVDVVLHPRRTVLEAEFPHIERDVLRAFRAVQLAMKKTPRCRILQDLHLARSAALRVSSGWPAYISGGFLLVSMHWQARCCRCRAVAVISRHVRNMPRLRWPATVGGAVLRWRCARVLRCHPWSRRGRRGGFDPVP